MRRRPWGIWVVIGLQIALLVTLLPWFQQAFPNYTPADNVELGHNVYIAWGVINLIAAVWLWTLSRRGWVLTMVLVGIGLSFNLALWFFNEPAWIRMAIQAVTAFYLNSAPVRALFERKTNVTTVMLRDTEGA